VTNARGKNTRMGGSDPDFDGFQPPKIPWGRSRPPRGVGAAFLPRAGRKSASSSANFSKVVQGGMKPCQF
jgi:hypothetical protein